MTIGKKWFILYYARAQFEVLAFILVLIFDCKIRKILRRLVTLNNEIFFGFADKGERNMEDENLKLCPRLVYTTTAPITGYLHTSPSDEPLHLHHLHPQARHKLYNQAKTTPPIKASTNPQAAPIKLPTKVAV